MPYPELACKTTHIGSFPFDDVEIALTYALKFDIPAWPQLPKFKTEGMILQACEGLPGFDPLQERIDFSHPEFENGLLKIYEDHQRAILEENSEVLIKYLPSETHARALRPFIERMKSHPGSWIKGQITGPFTLASSLKDLEGQNLLFIPDLRDFIVKFLTLKALSQANYLSQTGKRVIIFLDEPGLAGFGSSGFLTVSKDEVISMLQEIIHNLRQKGVIAGVHVCANTDWDLVFNSDPDIVSFDSFTFFEKFILYSQGLNQFLKEKGRFIAWGCVPTDKENLSKTNRFAEIEKVLLNQLETLSNLLNLPVKNILKHSLFTPACGMGSLTSEEVDKVVELLQKIKSIVLK